MYTKYSLLPLIIAGKPNVINSRSQFWPHPSVYRAHNTMAVLEILEFPDPRLRTEAKSVKEVTKATRGLIDDMFETMYAAPGIGLAATQVNVHQRLLVMDVSSDQSEPLVFINPEYRVLDPETGEYDEGCLSVPGFYETVVRPQKIEVSALDREGKPFKMELEELAAICLQHEVDHLNGKLFVDYISPLKRQRIRKKLEKDQRRRA
jgi:peptide deformylase